MLVSVYIRKDDEALWRELPNKSEAISSMLRGQKLTAVKVVETTPRSTEPKKVPSPRVSLEEVAEIFNSAPIANLTTADQLPAKPVRLCKIHGTKLTEMGQCLQKGH